MKRSIDDPRGYIMKLQPLYIEMFRMAHAVVGNLELAEYVLKKAVYEAFLRRDEWRERMSFHEGISQTVRMVALGELAAIRSVGSFESDWTPPALDLAQLTPEQRALEQRLSREPLELLRVLTLYYACGLRVSQIGQVVGKRPGAVRDMLYRHRSRLERSAPRGAQNKHHMEDSMERLLLLALRTGGSDVPDEGMVFRAFERDADASPKARRSLGRVVSVALCALGVLLCVLMFWVVSVLMEPGSPSVAAAHSVHQESTRTKP